jgi:hypothetical protein
MTAPFDFDDEFASPASWAALYRKLDLQVIPAHMPQDGGQWKRPLLAWIEFQDTLTSPTIFGRWYDPETGDYRRHRNMGTITGSASSGAWVLDLDNKPGQQAEAWWTGLLAVHNSNMEPETPIQRTGGGGRQLLFRAPLGWRPPTFKTPTGVDVRGQGGFAMLPPSRHASGNAYSWEPGAAPWQVEIMTAPDWLIDAIETLRLEHGGTDQVGEHTPTPVEQNAFGLTVNGREEKLLQAVWGAVVDLYRESPVPPSRAAQEAEIDRLWGNYERTTKSRLSGLEFGQMSNAEKLEHEGRGISELRRKWAYAMKGWDTKVKAAAAQPRPNPQPENSWGERLNEAMPPETPAAGEFDTGKPAGPPPRMKLVTPFHGQAPDRQWLVKDWIVEGAVNSLYAGSGLGKSLIALQLGAAVSLGVRWLGMPTKPGRVLMVSCEDDADELHRRTDDIKRAMGYALGWPFPDLHITDRVGEENRLAVLDRTGNIAAGPFLDPLEAEINALKPALLILDTLADVYAANEIDRGQVNFFLKTILGGLIKRQEAQGHTLTLILLGHPSDAGKAAGGKGYSGSGAWEAGVRSRLYLVKPEDGPDERILTRGKANYASAGIETGLRLTWEQGMFKADRELDDADPERRRLEQAVLREVKRAWADKLPLSAKPGHRRNVYVVLAKQFQEEGFEPQATRQVIRQMVEDGQLWTVKRSGMSGLDTENGSQGISR